MSRYNDNPLMEPIFFTPPRGADRRMPLHKGGGGGSSSVYYANQDKLLGVQADIAQNMYNTYANYAPTRLDAMDKMVNEAMDGTLADRARSTAAADAGASLGTSLAGAQRSLERYGTTLNPNALNANLTNTALSEGAMRTGAMNRAQQWAEGQKWARNSDMYGTLQGMPGTATQALGSAASGYGQMAGQQNQVNMANAMGYGQAGGMIGYGLFARDGGYIHEGEVVRHDDEPGYSFGGDVGDYMEELQPGGFVGDLHNKIYATAERIRPGGFVGNIHDQLRPGGTMGEIYNRGMPGRQAWIKSGGNANGFAHGGYVEPGYALGGPAYSMPKLGDWRNYSTTQQDTGDSGSPVGQFAAGMAPALATMGVKKYVGPYIKEAVGGAWDKAVAGYNHAQNVAGMQQAADAELAAIQAGQNTAAEGASSGLTTGTADAATGGAMQTGAEAAAVDTAATAGTEAAGTAAAETAAVEAGAATTEAAAAEAAAAAAAETAAAEAAAAGTAEAAGAAATMGPVGWIGAAALGTYALGNAMDWWADGGPVPHEPMPNRGLRKNMIPGGHVRGPGTPTSDSIPAWLSDGEYVINADAVKAHGKEKLEKINQKGLKKRKAKAKAAAPKATGIKKPVKK